MFKGLLIEKEEGRDQTVGLTEIDEARLPEGEVTVDVAYSTLNYKDGLALFGTSPVVRKFPMVPGIDFAGTVSASDSAEFSPGDRVILNGFGVGEKHWGGLAEKARVKADWLVPCPAEVSFEAAMGVGTAGYTAMLCVLALEKHGLTPSAGPILVTGATGGVGSFAVAFLAKRGFEVWAATGSAASHDYLRGLGAKEIIERQKLSEKGKPLGKEQWAGAVDSVGSHTLANVLASTKYGGAVAACGLAQGADLPATVMPFILRGVSLLGVDSVMRPKADRVEAWTQIASVLDESLLSTIVSETVGLSEAVATAERLMQGKLQGRAVVKVAG